MTLQTRCIRPTWKWTQSSNIFYIICDSRFIPCLISVVTDMRHKPDSVNQTEANFVHHNHSSSYLTQRSCLYDPLIIHVQQSWSRYQAPEHDIVKVWPTVRSHIVLDLPYGTSSPSVAHMWESLASPAMGHWGTCPLPRLPTFLFSSL